MKIKKVFKYMTGQPIPEGAIYLSTVVGMWQDIEDEDLGKLRIAKIVQHYFLVELEDK